MTGAWRDTFVIAKREFLERVRTKWFLAGTLLGPIFMIAMIVVPAVIAGSGGEGTKLEIIDQSPPVEGGIKLGSSLAAEIANNKWTATIVAPDTTNDAELDRIRKKAINGFIRIPADGLDGGEIVYRGDNASSQAVQIQFRHAVTQAVLDVRARREKISPDALARLKAEVHARAEHTTGAIEGASAAATFIIGYILAFILYMVITLYGVSVMRSVVVEKSSRVMEFMVAAVKPRALMGGKILGGGAAGLLQVAIWLAIGALSLTYREQLLGLFGASGAGGATLPPLAGIEIAVVITYFVLGYFFYSSMYAAAGAMVSSEQETQQVQMPVTMLLVIGIVCLQVISNDPRGSTAGAMTMVPLWSPILMPMRYVLGGATLGEVGISLGILAISTYLVVRAAAKIYRVGILMYGKRPGLAELWRWLRY
jgi:ABC-2 type transport system permease protein